MSQNTTTLKASLKKESRLLERIQVGIGAFLARDIPLIVQSERSRIGDSLDLDAASQDEFPQSNRWDYILSIPDRSEIIGIEPHSAKDSEISVVIAKKKHAATYLRSHLVKSHQVKRWLWVSHGKVNFSRMDKMVRRLNQNGIEFKGRMLRSLG